LSNGYALVRSTFALNALMRLDNLAITDPPP
jgi:hypothetical protein